MDLTMAEKRDLIERITELANINVLSREDRDNIFWVCMGACGMELSKIRMGAERNNPEVLVQ